MTQRRSTTGTTRPTSSRTSLMDEDEEMDKELEQMIERANLKQQEAHFRQMGLNNSPTTTRRTRRRHRPLL